MKLLKVDLQGQRLSYIVIYFRIYTCPKFLRNILTSRSIWFESTYENTDSRHIQVEGKYQTSFK